MNITTRRSLLAAASGIGSALSLQGADSKTPASFAVEDQQPFNAQTRRLKITNNGRKVGSLIFSTDYPTHYRLKPEWYPVLTPAGFPVTDSHQYCFIHHQSIMCGHGRVRTEDGRVHDFYRKLPFPEEGRADKWHAEEKNLFHLGPSGIQEIAAATWTEGGSARIDLALDWRTREQNSETGTSVLIEKRRYTVSQTEKFTIIDHASILTPVGTTIVLEADRHSFCGVRVNDLIDVEDGGFMIDSEGRENPDGNYWDAEGERKTPRWVDCTGEIGVNVVGVTLFGHPKNLRNEWYMRDWGLMEVSAMLGTDVVVTKENPFRFAARYVAHDGEIDPQTAESLYEAFAATNPW